MNRTCNRVLTAAAVLLLAGMPVTAQQGDSSKTGARPTTPDHHEPGKADDAQRQRDMDKLMAAEQPGEMQDWLRKFTGTWRVEVSESPDGVGSTRTSPGDGRDNDKAAKAGDGGGTAWTEFKHGRHACTKAKGTFMGRPYEGAGVMGYNNVAKRFESVWHDNVHSGVAYMTGNLDSSKRELTMTGECADPATGRMTTKRSVTRWISDDHYVTEVFGKDSGGQEKRVSVMNFHRTSAEGITAVPDSTRDDMNRDGAGNNPRNSPRDNPR